MMKSNDVAMLDDSRRRLLLFFKQHLSLKKDAPNNDVRRVFGAPLSYAVQQGCTTHVGLCVPTPVHDCFSEIVARGLKTEGIFRLSGSVSDVTELQQEFDKAHDTGKHIDLKSYDIHVIVSTLKKYLRMLPEPVIPVAHQNMFLKAADECKTGTRLLDRLEELVNKLPPAHGDLLHYIILLASYIENHQDDNKMNREALAIVISPVCAGLDQHLKGVVRKRCRYSPLTSGVTMPMKNMETIMKKNATWKRIWMVLIEHHEYLLNSWLHCPRSSPLGSIAVDAGPSSAMSNLPSNLHHPSHPSTPMDIHAFLENDCPAKAEPRRNYDAIPRRRFPRKYSQKSSRTPQFCLQECSSSATPSPFHHVHSTHSILAENTFV